MEVLTITISTLTSAKHCQEVRDRDCGKCLLLVNVGEQWSKAAKKTKVVRPHR
jgi:hypothetical protein